jgi:uncharacterized phage protein (TIGR02218 family)
LKTIPSALLTHKGLPVTTLCRLMKVVCKDATVFGFTTLDIDVEYDDQTDTAGPVTYRSLTGAAPSRISSAAGTGVDNADFAGILADLDTLGLTEEQVRAGKLDYADAYVYEVNYNDLTAGRHEIIARGKVGEVTISGEAFTAEFRSLSQLLRQNTTQVTSLTCRTQYGSTQCGATLSWDAVTITGVSIAEPDRIFTDSARTEAADYYVPGVFRVLTGDNAGAEVEVEQNSAGVFTLARPLYFPLQVGDTGEVRIDCPKTVAGCKDRGQFPNNFRGEHLIPVDREGELLTPGAGL